MEPMKASREDFLEVLESWKVEDIRSTKYTLISIDPRQKYQVSPSIFWKAYDTFYKHFKPIEPRLFLMERPVLDYSILRFDIDFRSIFPNEVERNTKRLYSARMVFDIIKHIHFLITDLADKECDISIKNPNNLICACFEKDGWTKKDGIHLVFPNLFVKNDFQSSYFVTKLQIFLNSITNSVKHLKDITVDKVCSLSWVILGCSKSRESEMYTLKRILDKNLVSQSLKEYDIPSLYSINRLSSIVYGKSGHAIICERIRDPESIQKDFDQIKEWEILENLSIDRCNNYDQWIDVGITLYNIGCGNNKFLNLWKEFSQRCEEKYNENVCETKWQTFTSRDRTIASLIYYFKQDARSEFEKRVHLQNMDTIHKQLFPFSVDDESERDFNIKQLFKKCILQHLDIARIFYSKYNNDIVWRSSSTGKGTWFQFRQNKWTRIQEQVIERLIYDEITPHINEILTDIDVELRYHDDIKLREFMVNNKFKINSKLKDSGFVKGCIQSARALFLRPNFILDSNKYLLGCNNGVLDLERGYFRASSPDDFISMSTMQTYKEYSYECEEVQELLYYLEEIITDPELRENVMEIYASMLIGCNDDKNVFVALGKTNAGKSSIVSLLSKSLGDYAFNFPKEIIYQRATSSSSARPELARSEGKRIAFINELAKKEAMNVGTLKELSGNDRFFVRRLYSDGEEITPMFSIYLSSNEVPKIPRDDDATWGRIKIVKFDSLFTPYAPLSREEQLKEKMFPMLTDNSLQEKLKKLAPVMLWLLFEIYKSNSKKYSKGVPICKLITEATTNYRNENDPIFKFYEERITKDDDRGYFIECTRMFQYYSSWYKQYYPDQKVKLDRDAFKTSFEKIANIPRVKGKPSGSRKKVEGWDKIIHEEKNETSD